jgi:hypothetical protein
LFPGTVFIALGKMTPTHRREEVASFSTVTEGAFYFSVCPWPPSDGQLSPFRAESIPPNDAAK